MEKKAIESTFRAFLMAINRPGSEGFLYETADKKVYSFETWLRQKGQHTSEQIQAWCEHIKSTSYIKNAGTDFQKSNARIFFKSILWLMLAGLFLYLLAGAFLLLFDVSIWNLTALLSFVIGGAGFMCLFWGWLFIKAKYRYKKQKAGQPASANMITIYIKIFDSDTFDFIPQGNKLFKG